MISMIGNPSFRSCLEGINGETIDGAWIFAAHLFDVHLPSESPPSSIALQMEFLLRRVMTIRA